MNGGAVLERSLSLADAAEAFLLSRRVGNCTERTLETYKRNLDPFLKAVGSGSLSDVTMLGLQRYFTDLLNRMKPITVHQTFRVLRTFFSWCVESGLLSANPVRGIKMRVPKTLPRVPEDDAVRRLLHVCGGTYEGRRNRALVALLADSGLRISEALRLRIDDLNFASRTLAVRGGKGQKDGVGHFGAGTIQVIREWLRARPDAQSEDFVFCDKQGRPLSRHHGTVILHRLSTKAGIDRKIGPHALRHYAATTLLKETGDLEMVRKVLRHEMLTMTLRYAHLTNLDVSKKFRRASPIDTLLAGR